MHVFCFPAMYFNSHSGLEADKTTTFSNGLVAGNVLGTCLEIVKSLAFFNFICFLTFMLFPQTSVHKLVIKSIFALRFFFCLLFAKLRVFPIISNVVLFSTLCMTAIAHSYLYFFSVAFPAN